MRGVRGIFRHASPCAPSWERDRHDQQVFAARVGSTSVLGGSNTCPLCLRFNHQSSPLPSSGKCIHAYWSTLYPNRNLTLCGNRHLVGRVLPMFWLESSFRSAVSQSRCQPLSCSVVCHGLRLGEGLRLDCLREKRRELGAVIESWHSKSCRVSAKGAQPLV